MDTLANMLITLKNAGHAGHRRVVVPYAKFQHAVAGALLKRGFIKGFEKKDKKVGGPVLAIELLYTEKGTPKITEVKRVSKPGRRVYVSVKKIRPVKSGHGALVLSTPKGVLVDTDAQKELVGGEALFEIW